MLEQQMTLNLSPYSELYDLLVPKTNILRRMVELCNFEFIYEELEKNYRVDFGRKAYSPILLFKYLLLKQMYDLSDVDVVERSLTDMAFKYFLGLAPEDSVIDPSTLTKFRKLRLKDEALLDSLIEKTVQIALEKDIIKSNTIIVDSTYTKSRYLHKKPQEVLRERSKKLRKTIYKFSPKMKELFPDKPEEDNLEAEIHYTKQLIEVIDEYPELHGIPAISEQFNYVKETLEDDVEHLEASVKEEARIGHKSADTSFYGYKEHLAMTEEGIITACVVTSGEKTDGRYLEELYHKTKDTGFEVENIVGDKAYSWKEHIKFSHQEGFNLIAKLSDCNRHTARDGFEYNKDSGMYVCPEGHESVKRKRTNTNNNKVTAYFFDIEKCKHCSLCGICYKEGNKSRSITFHELSALAKERLAYEETEAFKKKSRIRYKIEAKNSELKNRHGLKVASGAGLFNMHLQAATAIFVTNLKRIITILDQENTGMKGKND